MNCCIAKYIIEMEDQLHQNVIAELSKTALNEHVIAKAISNRRRDAWCVVISVMKCLKKIFRSGYSYKKAGVTLSGIIPRGQVQLSIFDSGDRKRSDKLMRTLDHINGRMGRDILKLSSSGINNKWKIGKERLSPCYTTRWSEILEVKV